MLKIVVQFKFEGYRKEGFPAVFKAHANSSLIQQLLKSKLHLLNIWNTIVRETFQRQ